MSELPVTCSYCYEESMINLDKMERRKIDKIKSALGFTCQKCEGWNPIFKLTPSLEKAFDKLDKKNPSGTGYSYLFAKVLKKAEGIQDG